jgi:TetR/AcrR family transcriptional regulator
MSLEAPLAKVDGDRTRLSILKAAEELFVRFGFAATSMATVAKQAGVTKSLIHHHFGSKRELWDAVKLEVMHEYGRKQEQLFSERAPDLVLLEDSFVVYFRFLQSHPNVVRLWTWMAIEDDAQCAEISKSLASEGVRLLERGQASGTIRSDVDPEYILAHFFTLVRGWFIERPVLRCDVLKDTPNELCDERYLRNTLKVWIAGLAPRTEPPTTP